MSKDIPDVSGLAHIEPLNIERFAMCSWVCSWSNGLSSLTRRAAIEALELKNVRGSVLATINPHTTK